MNQSFISGIDNPEWLLSLQNASIGLITNDKAHNAKGLTSRMALIEMGLNLKILFSPEHGLNAAHPDGEKVSENIDVLTGLPVKSLYFDSFMPRIDDLKNLDALLFDIPDVGSRFYTYLWTMTYIMEACALAGLPLFILDRPNPLGGDIQKCEGPMLNEEQCSSFIGRWNIPVRHGCTMGELARFFQATRLPGLHLQVIPCSGWQRHQNALNTNLHFLPTSPAITDAETALLYTGLGILEGINVSEGRGTNFPFKQMGAPWINAAALQLNTKEHNPKGIAIEIISFTPEWGIYAGELCHGLRFEVTDEESFRPVAFVLLLIKTLIQLYPLNVAERLYPTLANPTGKNHLDRLTGVHLAFEKIKDEVFPDTNVNPGWSEAIRPYLLYN